MKFDRPPFVLLGATLLMGWAAPLSAAPATYVVTNTNDSGAGSLRQAITDANANAGSTITFNLPGSGPQTIALTTGLPGLTANTFLAPGAIPVADAGAEGVSLAGVTLTLGTGSLVDSGVQMTGGTATLDVAASNSATIGGLNGGGAVTLEPGSLLDIGLNGQDGFYGGALNGNSAVLEKSGADTAQIQSASVSLVVIEDGTLHLTGGFSNSTAVEVGSGGVLDLHNAASPVLNSLSGSGLVTFGASNLQLGGNGGDSDFAGDLAGTGTVQKEGSGTVTLDGVNQTSGGVSVNDGLLIVGDSANPGALVEGPVVVSNASATLQGYGTLQGAVTVNGAGLLEPGSPGRALRVGSLTENVGANTTIAFDPTDSGSVAASGAARLDGPLSLTSVGGSYLLHYSYVILTAGSISGAYAAAFTDLSGMTPTVAYGSNAVTAFLNRAGYSFKPLAGTDNEMAVAGALDASLLTAGNGFGAKLNELYAMPSGQGQALGAMAGVIYPSIPAFLLDNARFEADLLFERMEQGPPPGPAPPNLPFQGMAGPLARLVGAPTLSGGASSPASAPGFWMQTIDSFGSWNANGQLPAFDQDHYGVLGGLEGKLSSRFTAGLEAAYSHGDLKADDGSGTLGEDSLQAGFYVKGRLGFVETGLLLGGAVDRFKSARTLSLGGDVNDLAGDFGAQELSAAFQLGEPVELSGLVVEPLEGVQYVHLNEDGFTETGSGLALRVPAQELSSLRPFGGIDLHQGIPLGGGAELVPALRLTAGGEVLKPPSQSSLTFDQSGAPAFVAKGFAEDPFFVEMNLGVALGFSPGTRVFADFDGGFGADQNLNTLDGGLQVGL